MFHVKLLYYYLTTTIIIIIFVSVSYVLSCMYVYHVCISEALESILSTLYLLHWIIIQRSSRKANYCNTVSICSNYCRINLYFCSSMYLWSSHWLPKTFYILQLVIYPWIIKRLLYWLLLAQNIHALL